jgi:hypothetical protein
MTKKRFQKLTRAYFTELNAWGKANGCKPLPMGEVYRAMHKNTDPQNWCGKTRAEWWETVSKGNNFGVGVKAK